MVLPRVFIHLAGGVQLCVASANVFAFGKFAYLEHLQKVPLVVRQVFMVQNVYLMLTQVGLSLLCFNFADELTGSRMGHALAAFLAFLWGLRVVLQLCYYDRDLRRANRLFDALFLAADGYLATVYVLAAMSRPS